MSYQIKSQTGFVSQGAVSSLGLTDSLRNLIMNGIHIILSIISISWFPLRNESRYSFNPAPTIAHCEDWLWIAWVFPNILEIKGIVSLVLHHVWKLATLDFTQKVWHCQKMPSVKENNNNATGTKVYSWKTTVKMHTLTWWQFSCPSTSICGNVSLAPRLN